MQDLQASQLPNQLRRVEDMPARIGRTTLPGNMDVDGDADQLTGRRRTTDLLGLVYVSSATHWLSPSELGRIVRRARERNAADGITGVLLYSCGNFMQYLEGPGATVEKVFERIKDDPLHAGIIELLHEPIQAREFIGWSMAFKDISAFGVSDPPQIDDVFAAEPTDDFRKGRSPAHMLLTKFWEKGGVRRAS